MKTNHCSESACSLHYVYLYESFDNDASIQSRKWKKDWIVGTVFRDILGAICWQQSL